MNDEQENARAALPSLGEVHFEPFVQLAGLDDDQVLIAWGGFWFCPFQDGRGWRTVDDEELPEIDPGRTETIGARSEPYGEARVQVFTGDGRLAGEARTKEANHVWITGLDAATDYRYEVTVDGRPWVPETCLRWHAIDDERGELRPAGRTYDCRFRTFPAPGAATTARFVAFGDYGIGIQASDGAGRHQRHVAAVLEHLVEQDPGIDFVVTLGDNIYHAEDTSVGGSGREDDDWYFSYYEPYRFVISRVPVYPSVGNHDASDTEHSDDRGQLADNHFTDLRFHSSVEEDRESVETEGEGSAGLFYRLSFGRLVELLCIDTSEAAGFDAERYFDDPEHQAFLDRAFDRSRTDRSHWLIPFGHHPPYCAGPKHLNDEAQIRSLVPRYRDGGVHLVLAGHEHNFQHAVNDGIHYLVSGAAGKLRPGEPEGIDAAGLRSWAAEPHLLLIEADSDRLSILPVARLDSSGRPVPVEARAVGSGTADLPIIITR
jgi:tartrate-resistant acid phosphatase type 5